MTEVAPAKSIEPAESKEKRLRALMRSYGRVLVAYSGGVDSTYLAYIANDELRSDAVCVTGISASVAAHQRDEASEVAKGIGLNHIMITTDELSDPRYAANPSNRCYFCKSELFSKLAALADELNIDAVVDGTNADDIAGHRPGMIAAGESGVHSPLADIGLTKDEIRLLSRRAGLPQWDKPASPCLASRIAYGVPVTIERLSKVDRAESYLRELGFNEFRVRVHGDLARIEIAPPELKAALTEDFAARVSSKLAELGFKYVTLDLLGYRSGAMNETLGIRRSGSGDPSEKAAKKSWETDSGA